MTFLSSETSDLELGVDKAAAEGVGHADGVCNIAQAMIVSLVTADGHKLRPETARCGERAEESAKIEDSMVNGGGWSRLRDKINKGTNSLRTAPLGTRPQPGTLSPLVALAE